MPHRLMALISKDTKDLAILWVELQSWLGWFTLKEKGLAPLMCCAASGLLSDPYNGFQGGSSCWVLTLDEAQPGWTSRPAAQTLPGSPLSPQASLGGCVRMIVTGAAPASPAVLGFLRAALGCQVLPFCGLPGAMTCVWRRGGNPLCPL